MDGVVVVPAATYRRLMLPKGSLVQFLAASPLRGARLNLTRAGARTFNPWNP